MLTAALSLLAGSVFLGRFPAPYITGLSDLMAQDLVQQVVLQIRIPRILSAFVTGMVLSASGWYSR